jgi:hypothetical protein
MLRRISALSWLLIVIGVVFLVIGIVYLTTKAPDLPSFFPGAVEHSKHPKAYTKRGIAALLVSAASFVGVWYNDFRAH